VTQPVRRLDEVKRAEAGAELVAKFGLINSR
jgi:hypothetical protein